MTIYIKEPGKAPGQIVVPNNLHMLQQLVGGYIETVTLTEDLCIICDEEGRLKGKEFNCEICGIDFVGTILMVGVDGEEFTDVPAGTREAFHALWEGWDEA